MVAQKSEEICFIVPEFLKSTSEVDYYQAIAFLFAMYNLPATISQPANPLFPKSFRLKTSKTTGTAFEQHFFALQVNANNSNIYFCCKGLNFASQ